MASDGIGVAAAADMLLGAVTAAEKSSEDAQALSLARSQAFHALRSLLLALRGTRESPHCRLYRTRISTEFKVAALCHWLGILNQYPVRKSPRCPGCSWFSCDTGFGTRVCACSFPLLHCSEDEMTDSLIRTAGNRLAKR